MKSPYVSELQPNQLVTATLLVQYKDIRQKKTGEPCLTLTLSDRTGEIDARMWDNVAEVMSTFERDDFVRVRGLIQVHHNRLQMTVHKIHRQSADAVDFTDFFAAAERPVDEMWAELLAIVEGIGNPHLKALLTAVVQDPEIAGRFRMAPAAKNVHHAYIGGLLEHVLSMCSLAKVLSTHYKDVDLDLLLTGVVLHDIGKIHELTYDRSFGYSSDGQLLGHIIIGVRMLSDKLAAIPNFPPRLRSLLEHLIVSHHGEIEYGSPKLPMFAEALLLHHIDNVDSKMACMRSSLHRDRLVDGCWTGYIPTLERPILKKQKYLDEGDAAGVPVPSTEAAAAPKSVGVDGVAPVSAMPPQASDSAGANRPRFSATPFADKLKAALGGTD